jgi:hypothetical protein
MPRFWRRRGGHGLRAASDDQAPGDQRAGVTGPAGLHGKLAQVDLVSIDHHLLARRRTHPLGLHVPQRTHQRQQPARVLEALGRLRLLQAGQHAADFAQVLHPVGAHAQGHSPRHPEQVDQGGNFVTHWICNQYGRAACPQHLVSERCHFEPRRHRLCEAYELTLGFELPYEVAQIPIFHAQLE